MLFVDGIFEGCEFFAGSSEVSRFRSVPATALRTLSLIRTSRLPYIVLGFPATILLLLFPILQFSSINRSRQLIETR